MANENRVVVFNPTRLKDETCCHHYIAKGQKKISYITHRRGKVNGGAHFLPAWKIK